MTKRVATLMYVLVVWSSIVGTQIPPIIFQKGDAQMTLWVEVGGQDDH